MTVSERITNEELSNLIDVFSSQSGWWNPKIAAALEELAELRANPAPSLGSDERAALREYIDVLNAGYDKASAALEGLGKFHTRAEIEREMQYRKRAGLNDDGTWSDPPQTEREDVPVPVVAIHAIHLSAQARYSNAFDGGKLPMEQDARDYLGKSLDEVSAWLAWLALREGKE